MKISKKWGASAAAAALVMGSAVLASPATAAPGDIVVDINGTVGNLTVTGGVLTADCEAGTASYSLPVSRVSDEEPAVLSLHGNGPLFNTNITDSRVVTADFNLAGTAGSSTSYMVASVVPDGEEFNIVPIASGTIDCPAPPFEAESTLTLYAQYDGVDATCYTEGVDDNPPLIAGTPNEVEGERITAIYVDGVRLAGDAENRRLPGTYSYTYDVTNLATNEVDAGISGGTFTVVACEEDVFVEPTIAAAKPTPSADGSGVDYSVTVDLGDAEAASVVVADENNTYDTLEFTESGTLTGSVDLECGTYEFVFYFADSNVGPGQTYPVTIECESTGGGDGGDGGDGDGSGTPVDPTPPSGGEPTEPAAPAAPVAPMNNSGTDAGHNDNAKAGDTGDSTPASATSLWGPLFGVVAFGAAVGGFILRRKSQGVTGR